MVKKTAKSVVKSLLFELISFSCLFVFCIFCCFFLHFIFPFQFEMSINTMLLPAYETAVIVQFVFLLGFFIDRFSHKEYIACFSIVIAGAVLMFSVMGCNVYLGH